MANDKDKIINDNDKVIMYDDEQVYMHHLQDTLKVINEIRETEVTTKTFFVSWQMDLYAGVADFVRYFMV